MRSGGLRQEAKEMGFVSDPVDLYALSLSGRSVLDKEEDIDSHRDES